MTTRAPIAAGSPSPSSRPAYVPEVPLTATHAPLPDLPPTTRNIIGTFFKKVDGRLRLDSLEVIADGYGKFYCVDFSRRYGYIFHMSGMGPRDPADVSGIYFISGGVNVKEAPSQLCDDAARARNKTRRLRRLPKTFAPEPSQDLLDWLESNGIDDQAVWCSTCCDWLPGMTLCGHAWWCDKAGWYSTPDEPCMCANREECEDV